MNEMIVKNVDLMGDTIMAAQDHEGVIWVGVRWICNALDMTEGQMKRQIKNIKKDMVFGEGGSNQLPLPTGQGKQEVFCIRNDFIPLWLAKINITQKTRDERPEFSKKLLEYQLKAKEILAEAFLPKQEPPKTIAGQIQLLAQGNVELNKRVDELDNKLEKAIADLPILGIEETKISNAVKRKGVECLGGKESAAYNDRCLRQKLYSDLHRQLRREFGVSTYKAIKRSQTDTALSIIRNYNPPIVIFDQIEQANAQMNIADMA